MKKYIKSPIIALFAGVSAIAILGDSSAFAQNRYGTPTTNHVPPAQFKAHHMRPMVNHGPMPGRYIKDNRPKKYSGVMARLRDERHLAYQVRPPHPGMGMFQQWVNYEPEYTLYPGDQLDIVVSSAPELSRTLT